MTNWNMPQKQKSGLQMAATESDKLITSGRYEIYNTGHPQEDYFNMYRIDDKERPERGRPLRGL